MKINKSIKIKNMNKQKAVLIMAVVLTAAGIAMMTFLITRNNQQIPANGKQPVSQEKQSYSGPQTEPNAKVTFNPLPQLPAEIKGKIVGISPSSLIIDQPSGALSVPFNLNSTPVFKGSNKTKASALDLKAGTEVTAHVDTAINSAYEIIIIQ